MDANKTIITKIFNNSTLIEVPFFQRSYVWKEDLWARFLDDMEYVTKTNRPHFFGSIILKKGRKPQSGEKFTECWTVVDGQQRLTTFLIFMKVLCLKLGELNYFNSQFRIMGDDIALRHGKNDIESFEKIMSFTSLDDVENTALGSRIIEAYNFFASHIDVTKLEIMKIWTNTQFVRIDLEVDEDEQQIFDTINSLGVNLTTSELLKNYFFSRETLSEYESKWMAVFEKDEEAKTYWEAEIEIGRKKKAMIDIFFDAYFQIFIQDKQYSISTDDKSMYGRIENLAQSYQHFINTYCDGDKSVVLGRMKDYATCFRDVFKPDSCERNIPPAFGTERLNVIIFGLKNSTLIPYVLYVAKNVYDIDEQNRIYGILESYLMRRVIVHATAKNYNNLFTSLILNKVLSSEMLLSRLRCSGDSTMYIPDNAELQAGFQQLKLANIQTKGILYLIESKIRPTNSATLLQGFNSYSLEHLMPKKWRNHWDGCDNFESAKARDEKLLTLGNLAIIPQSLNASIRDANWQIKKAGNGVKKPGLILCAAGLNTLQDALQTEKWNEFEIEKRAAWLFKKAIEIWNFGETSGEYDQNFETLVQDMPILQNTSNQIGSGIDVGENLQASQNINNTGFEIKEFYFRSEKRDSYGKADILIHCGHSNKRRAILKAGSKVSREVVSSLPRILEKRRELEARGVLVNRILQEDMSFDSQSGAGQFLNGKSFDGNTNWKTTDGSIPLKKLL